MRPTLIETYVPATQMKPPARMVRIETMDMTGRLYKPIRPSNWTVSYHQKNPAMPYVYHEANKAAEIPIRYEKIGTDIARIKAKATAIKHKMVHTDHPRKVCSYTCLEWRKRRTKTNLAAV